MTPTAMWGIGIAVVIKVAAAGYVLHVATDATAEQTRKDLLAHTKRVIAKLEEIGHAPEQEELRSLRKDLSTLRRSVGLGWTKKHEVAAAARVAAFVLWAHTKATGRGVMALADNLLTAGFDSLFNLFEVRGNPDGDVRAA